MKDFFISYNKADREWAEWIAWQLEEAKYTTVLQAWDFRPGSNFVLEMQRASAEAQRTIAVLSPDYLAASFTQPEWAAAFARDPTGEKGLLLPVRVRECDLKGLLPQIVYIDLVGLDETVAKERLLAGVGFERAKPTTAPAFPGKAARAVPERPRFPGSQPAPAVWNVPQARNPNFTGREEMLAALRAALASGQAAALTHVPQAIHGLGGVGKTQLAIEYACRHRAEYPVVWWVRAEEPATLAGDYAALAAALDLLQKDAREQAVVVEAARRWLEQNTGWLLVFDNAGEPADIRDYLPRSAGGHVIITSRNPAWGAVARPLGVQVFERFTSVEFLLKRTDQADQEAAGKLAEALGDLPLALEQAAAYIEATRESVSGYLRMFRERRAELLKRPSPSSDATVAATWEMSFQEVERRSPAAAALLNLCAFLAPDDIPLDIVQQAPGLPEPLAEAAADPVQFDDAIAALRRFSLVSRSRDVLSVHRLVQAVTRERLAEEARKRWAAAAVRAVNRAFPFDSDDVRTWPVCSRLLAHALGVADHCEPLAVAPDETGRLLNQAGLYLRGRAEFARARACYERALNVYEAAYGPEHPDVATVVNNLGNVLLDQGELTGARTCFERALKINEAAYGLDHPDVARDVNNLGMVLKAQGDLAAARACFERALKIDEAACGLDHPDVARNVNNLGNVLLDQGDLAGARACFERALKIDEAVFGPEHPTVGIDVGNLGRVLSALCELERARVHHERAVRIHEAAYGNEHPYMATGLNNLGNVLHEQGDLGGARACYERALKIDEAAYGRDHPTVANRVNNLGSVLQAQGDLAGARACAERALGICRKFLGEDHPNTVLVRKNLESLGEKGRGGTAGG
jgi:tetratricopeptide (TPR) repeat protein